MRATSALFMQALLVALTGCCSTTPGASDAHTLDVHPVGAPLFNVQAGANPQAGASFAALASGCPDDGTVLRNTPSMGQEQTFWCWAATDAMIEASFNMQVRQCEAANHWCSQQQIAACQNVDCCQTPEKCNVPGWPPLENLEYTRLPGPLSRAVIVQQIGCRKRPIAFSWHEVGGGGHIMVAVGFRTKKTGDFLIVNEPANGGDRVIMPYATYDKGTFMHWDDFADNGAHP
jgi:hypothetical protein